MRNMITLASCLAQDGPGDATYAKGRAHLVSGLTVTLEHRGERIEVGVLYAPAVSVGNGLGMPQSDRLAALDGDADGMAEHLLATGQRELVDQFYGLCLARVVLHLRLYEHGVAGGIVPDVYAKRLHTYGIRLDERDGTEDAKGLAALAEPPLTAAAAADPWRRRLHGRVVDGHL